MIRNFKKRLFGKLIQYQKTSDAGFYNAIPLEYVSNGDENGLFFYIGSNRKQSSWQNPHTSGKIYVGGFQSGGLSYTQNYVNRDTEYLFLGPTASIFIAFDIGLDTPRTINVTKYSLRNYTTADRFIRNWKLQGSNNVASNDWTGFNNATWTDLDIRINDTTMGGGGSAWGTYTANQNITTQFRFLRILLTGADSLGQMYLCTTEVEFYGLANIQ